MTTRPIRFYHRGQLTELNDAAPTRSVLDWLREDARCTGTKEGCNEGDCGACTVVIGSLAAQGAPDSVRGLVLETVNACIQFLPTLDGKALFTVEDLKRVATGPVNATPAPRADGALHPTQQAMVDCHGSQCGFCTPGFVMSMWAAYERHQQSDTRPTRQQLADELAGNLCRCTGYRPILDAGQRMFDLPAVVLDTVPVIAALRKLAASRDVTFEYAPVGAAAASRAPVFHAPRHLDALAALRERLPNAQLLAGSTDVGLWVNKQLRDLGDIIYVGDVDALKRIEAHEDGWWIGAGASLEAAWRALVQRWPALTDVWLRFASPPIRHAGTMGGNVANGSPIGDSAPVLMALDAALELRRGARVRRIALDEFYTGYMKNRLEPGEFVQAILVPRLPQAREVRAYKISKRFDCDISALCAGFSIELDGDTVREVRLAYGGLAAVLKRAAAAEATLRGQVWSQANVARAQAALAEDFQPLTDMRASAAYRLQVAGNLLQRFWLETRTADPLPAGATSVWSVMPHDVDAPSGA